MRGFNADDARALVDDAHRSVTEFVVADLLREVDVAARASQRIVSRQVDVDRLGDAACGDIVAALKARGFQVEATRDGDVALFVLRW